MCNSFISQWAFYVMWGSSQWNVSYDLFWFASTYPFKAYATSKVSAWIFWSKYPSWVVHILLPGRAWNLKKSTPQWAAILVMDVIRRYFEVNASFSFLGMSLERWCLMDLVIIVETTLYLREYRSWNTNWLSEICYDSAIIRPHIPRNKQGSELSL